MVEPGADRTKTRMPVSLTAQVTVELQFSGEALLKDTLGHPWDLTGVRVTAGAPDQTSAEV